MMIMVVVGLLGMVGVVAGVIVVGVLLFKISSQTILVHSALV